MLSKTGLQDRSLSVNKHYRSVQDKGNSYYQSKRGIIQLDAIQSLQDKKAKAVVVKSPLVSGFLSPSIPSGPDRGLHL